MLFTADVTNTRECTQIEVVISTDLYAKGSFCHCSSERASRDWYNATREETFQGKKFSSKQVSYLIYYFSYSTLLTINVLPLVELEFITRTVCKCLALSFEENNFI